MNHLEQYTPLEFNSNIYRKKKPQKTPKVSKKLLKKKEYYEIKNEINQGGNNGKECKLEKKEQTQLNIYINTKCRNKQKICESKKQQTYKCDQIINYSSTLSLNKNQVSIDNNINNQNIKTSNEVKKNNKEKNGILKRKKKKRIHNIENIKSKYTSTINFGDAKKRNVSNNNRKKKNEKTRYTLNDQLKRKKHRKKTVRSNNYNISTDRCNLNYNFSYSKLVHKEGSLTNIKIEKEQLIGNSKTCKPAYDFIKEKKNNCINNKQIEKKFAHNSKNKRNTTNIEGILKKNPVKKVEKKRVHMDAISDNCKKNINGKNTSLMTHSKSDIHETVEAYLINFCKNNSNHMNDYNNINCNSNRSNSNTNVIFSMNNMNYIYNNNSNNNNIHSNSSNSIMSIGNGNNRIIEPRGIRRIFNEELHYSELDVYMDEYRGNLDQISLNDSIADMEPLHMACRDGNLKLIKQLLMQGIDVNCKTKIRQFTPLHFSASKGNLDCVKVLIEYNANLNAKSIDNETPIWCASISNNIEICKYLIKKGVLLNNEVDMKCDSPLHAASMMGHFEIVKLLIENGAIMNSLDANFLEPIHYASFEGHKGIVKYLLRKQIQESLKSMMKSVVDVMKQHNSYSEHLEMQYYLKCKSLLKKRITSKVLCCAITSGNKKIVDIILKGGANPNYFDIRLQLFPIHASAITGNVGIFKKLVKKGANIFMKTTCNNLPFDLTEDNEIKQYILKESKKINIRNAFLIRMKSKNHIIANLPNDLFFYMCTFF